jgi:RNA recognition motif-containing protein
MAQQNLFIGKVAFATTDDDLRAYFEQIGEVESATIIKDHQRDNRSKGYGFVSFVNPDDNQKAIDQLNGTELDGHTISVDFARPKEERPKRDFNRNGNNGNSSFRQRSW